MTDKEIKEELTKKGFKSELIIDNGGYCLVKSYYLEGYEYEIIINYKGFISIVNHSKEEENCIDVTLMKDFAYDLKWILDNLKERKQ